MRRRLTVSALLLACAPLRAQPVTSTPAAELAALADTFDAAAGAPQGWQWLHASDGWPSHVRTSRLDGAGHLRIEPATSGWYADYRGPFLYRTVTGNVFIHARLRATGRASDVPQEPWSLGGLMLRAPRPVTPGTWEPRGENWLFVTTGAAARRGVPVFETKTTVNGSSALRLHPAPSGWVEVGLVRVGAVFVAVARGHDGAWKILERYYRPDLPQTLQFGLTAYTDWESTGPLRNDVRRFNTTVLDGGRPDLFLDVDHVRVEPVTVEGDPARLISYDVPNADVLRRLGLASPPQPANEAGTPRTGTPAGS